MSVPVENGQEIQPLKPVGEMTDREMAEETLLWLRSVGAALQQFQQGGMSGIMKMAAAAMGGKGRG